MTLQKWILHGWIEGLEAGMYLQDRTQDLWLEIESWALYDPQVLPTLGGVMSMVLLEKVIHVLSRHLSFATQKSRGDERHEA